MQRIAWPAMQFLAVPIDDGDAEMELQVRTLHLGRAAHEAARFRDIGGQKTPALFPPGAEFANGLDEKRRPDADQAGRGRGDIGGVVQMILQIAPHRGQMMDDRNAQRA